MSGKSTASEFARRRGSRDTRAEILAAAERYFAEHGFEATRLEDLATEVGIRRAAIFYHFSGKQELYAAVLDEVFGNWAAALPTGGRARRYPSNFSILPCALNMPGPAVTSTLVTAKSAGVIWLATKRL